MNLIVILPDSLRADDVGCYGNQWINTPNIDKLARESILFEQVYPEGLPTIPLRTALFTGRYTFSFRGWQPLEKTDVTLAETLKENGYVCSLITDTYHFFEPGMNFHRAFHCFRWIRGQERDAYVTSTYDSKK